MQRNVRCHNPCILELLLYRCPLHMDNVYGIGNPLEGLQAKEYLHLTRYDSSLQMDLDMELLRIKPWYMDEVDC